MFLQQITRRNISMRNYEEGSSSSSQAPQQYSDDQQQKQQQQELPYYQFLEDPLQIMQQQQPPPYEPNEIVIIDDDDDGEEDEDEEMTQAEAGETSNKTPVKQEAEEDGEKKSDDDDDDDDDILRVDLSTVEEYLTCPICLDIIRQTRTVTECLHRFCKECIDKAMRLGKHECPACRTHVASRRSLREDTIFDRLIAELYPNRSDSVDEDMGLNEDERALNQQIQASFAQTLRRQNEALPKRLTIPTTTVSNSRRRGGGRRGRKRLHNTNRIPSDSDDDININDQGTDPHLMLTGNSMGSSDHDANIQGDAVVKRERSPPTTDLVKIPEMPRWGRGGHRSQIRRDSGSGGSSSSRIGQGNRMSRLVNHLNQIQLEEEFDNEWDICVALITLDEQTMPSLEYPYISCSPDYSIKQLREFIAVETNVQLKEVELLLLTNPSFSSSGSVPMYDPSQGALKLLKAYDTVEGQLSHCTTGGVLVLGYRRKFIRE